MHMTRRQREVFDLVNRGWTDREIAERLHISEHTVPGHIARIAAKLPGPGTPRQRIRRCEWPMREAS